MATVTRPSQARPNLAEAHQKVRSPLHRLRGYIRRYVLTEAIAALVICLAVWFWVGLLLDYGSFQGFWIEQLYKMDSTAKLFTFDWVQDLPRWFRAILTGTAIALVCFFVELRKVLATKRDKEAAPKTGFARVFVEVLTSPVLLASVLIPSAILYLIFWIWVGASITSPWAIGLLVTAILISFTGLIVIKRLLYEFRDAALALVLEKRFPNELGDRLITAVELSDPREAEQFGYSAAMVEETIQEAARRVEHLPVTAVFDLKRLIRKGVLACLITLGLYLVAGVTMGVINFTKPHEAVVAENGEAEAPRRGVGEFVSATVGGFSHFNDLATIWFERTVLLQNVIWPRRAQLELVDFPDSGELKIGRGDPAPSIRARALKWVIADHGSAEGWRALTWKDLTPALLGMPVPTIALPPWPARDAERGLTMDEIELNLDKPETHKTLSPEQHKALRDVLDQLGRQAALPQMSRTMRMLVIPESIILNYKGKDGDGNFKLTRQQDYDYMGQFPDLKENVTFVIRAEDYTSATQRVTVVPPPSFEEVTREEFQPAYLYYYGPPEVLRGKKQTIAPVTFNARNVPSLTMNVPSGTKIVLTAKTNKELLKDGVKAEQRKDAAPLKAGVDYTLEQLDGNTIRLTFLDVRTKKELTLRMTDTDHVQGTKDVIVDPNEDATPEIEAKPEIIRTVNNMYMVTPQAIIPFLGTVNDVNGGLDDLSETIKDPKKPRSLEYVYTIEPIESPRDTAMRAVRAAGVVALPLAGPGIGVTEAVYQQLLPPMLVRKTKPIEGRMVVDNFKRMIEARKREIKPEDLDELLKKAPGEQRQVISSYALELDPFVKGRGLDNDVPRISTTFRGGIRSFDLLNIEDEGGEGRPRVKLKADENEVQQRYRMQLWLEAIDTNIETGRDKISGRNRGATKQKYIFQVVSEAELLVEIGREEQRLFDEFKRMMDELLKVRASLQQMNSDLTVIKDPNENFFSSLGLAMQENEELFDKQFGVNNKVHDDYERILNEMRINRIETPGIQDKVDKQIVGKLDSAKLLWDLAKLGLNDYHKTLENPELRDTKLRLTASREKCQTAQAQVQQLIEALNEVLDQMQGIRNINELIKILRVMEQKEQDSLERLQEHKKNLLKLLLGEK